MVYKILKTFLIIGIKLSHSFIHSATSEINFTKIRFIQAHIQENSSQFQGNQQSTFSNFQLNPFISSTTAEKNDNIRHL